ncbi:MULTISPECIES: hypothetical protein [Actinomadura]|uniref:Lipoprotein n=1 Tax=Actinomadura yumaensis TaxID=111807 RepID=A0ABW2CDL2_9ACTN|nr:hypothetical protein [Actinomadura sp. J1-007]MWK38135.1 hypothetical protein [Actinomadura sp. J1-007]
MRTAVALAALTLLVAGCSDEPESEAASPPSKRSATPAPCPASGAVVRKGRPDGASDVKVLGLDLHNCGPAAIRLKGYPVLGRLRARKDVAPPAVRAALLRAGFRADRTFTQPYRASAASDVPPPGSVFEIRAGERACVYGSVDPGRVTVRIDGPTREGACLEPFAH